MLGLARAVSAEAADWIAAVVARRCPNAVRCADAFHIVAWATDALDEVRRQAWNDARAVARAEPPRGRAGPGPTSQPVPAADRSRPCTGLDMRCGRTQRT